MVLTGLLTHHMQRERGKHTRTHTHTHREREGERDIPRVWCRLAIQRWQLRNGGRWGKGQGDSDGKGTRGWGNTDGVDDIFTSSCLEIFAGATPQRC
jgi:hypothetical protein